MSSYWGVFRKVLAGFLGLYVLVMGSFTYMKQYEVREDCRSEAVNQTGVLEDIAKDYDKQSVYREHLIKKAKEQGEAATNQSDKQFMTEGELESIFSMTLTNSFSHSSKYPIYDAVAIYDEEGLVAKNGYYLSLYNEDTREAHYIEELSVLEQNVNTQFKDLTLNEEIEYFGGKCLWEKGFWKERFYFTSTLVLDAHQYNVYLGCSYKPWEIAFGELKSVYIFAIAVLIIMSLILSYALWGVYKKQMKLEQTRRRLVDAISHELKTPLSVIEAYSEGLKEKIAEDKKDQYVDVIIDEVHQMNELIVAMLTLSKYESDTYKVQPELIDLKALVETSLAHKVKLAEENNIEVEQDCKAISFMADYKCMQIVMDNLLINAIAHTPANGRIMIGTKGNTFYIENQGNPINEKQLARVWDAFAKDEDGNNRSGKGTGLGLAIVKSILERHGFKYGIENTSIGVKVWFRLDGQMKKK